MEANDDQYWIVVNRNHAGPYTVGQLKAMGIAPDTYTWRRGLTQWVAASDIPELSAALWPAEPESSVAPVVEPVIFTPPAPPVRVVAQVAPVSPVTVPAGQPEADKAYCPPSYLWWSIVVAVVFSLPLGVVAIVFAAQVGKQWRDGDVAGARRSSERAAWCSVIGFVLGLMVMPFQILTMLL